MQSLIASSIRGSIGGITYLSGPNHAIIARARTSPVNPATTNQGLIRGAFSDASVLFEQLSTANRQLWDDYADGLEYQGPLGTYKCTGRQVCLSNVGTALYLDDRGVDVGTPDASPPTSPGFLSLADVQAIAPTTGVTGFQIQARNNNAVEVTVFVEHSIAFPVTRNRYKGPFLSSTLVGGQVASSATGTVQFDGLAEDAIYFAVVRAITADPPYRISPQYFVRAIGIATP